MPPRYSYWTIIAGGLPTAFRAARREELLPTFTRIRERHPDAEMKWFARGKLWDSPEQAREACSRRRGRTHLSHSRDSGWRPGGDHRDPRQKYKDARKQRNLRRRAEKFARKHGAAARERQASSRRGDASMPTPPHGDPLRRQVKRPFERREFTRAQGTGEPEPPTPPRDPDHEPRPGQSPGPDAPPRPSEPIVPAPGPPERGGSNRQKRPRGSPR